MKRYIIYILFLFINVPNLKAQCTNGNTHNALDTYWHYRYRLINYFMQVGMGTWTPFNSNPTTQGGFGQSIPAMIRNFSGGNNGCNNIIWWSDPGRQLGYYIGALASEYYLLNKNPNQPQNTNQTVMELFYALHAIFRLDSIGLTYWMQLPGNTIDKTIIPSGTTLPITWPGEGYMQSDDVPFTFYENVNQNPGTLSNYGGYGEVGSGIVGPVSSVNSFWVSDNWGSATSQDNYYALLMGCALTVKLLDGLPPITSFYDENGHFQNFGNSYTDLRNMAKLLGTQILQYIFRSQYILKFPDGTEIPDHGCATGYCQPLTEINSAFFSASPPSGCPINVCNGFALWNIAGNLCGLANIQCPPGAANIEMACELSAMSNDGSVYSGPDELIENLGNYPSGLSCAFCTGVIANNFGEDLLFEAVHQILYPDPSNLSFISACDMQYIINSAPYDGPYHHEDYLQGNPDYAGCGWASPNRFIWPPPFQSGGTGWSGNYNGLDYMLFYNLYCIVSQEYGPPPQLIVDDASYSSGTPTNLGNDYSPGPVFGNPDVYPFDWTSESEFSNYTIYAFLGSQYYIPDPYSPNTYGGPYTIQAVGCGPIFVNKLNVNANVSLGYGENSNGTNPPYTVNGINGDLIIQGGINSYIDLNPVEGNIIIQTGSSFDAYCPLNCCINSASYVFQNDPGLSGDKKPIKPKKDSIQNNQYQMNSEFNPKPNYDAIMCYPNPFHTQTTIEFAIKEPTPVSVEIYDIEGRKLADVIVNKAYGQGSYAAIFDGTNLASGSYVCVMTTKDDKKTIKIVKTK